MRSAPPVLVSVGRFAWGHALTAVLAAVLAASLGWVWLDSGASVAQGLAWGLLWGLAASIAGWVALREALPCGELAWDGESWQYSPDASAGAGVAVPVDVRVLWDAGPAMLVAVRSQACGVLGPNHWRGQRFAWLRAAQMPGQWHAWRCAVYAEDIL